MTLTLECAREADGRWLAEVPQLPGVMAYASSEGDAVKKAQILALRFLAEQLEARETVAADLSLLFVRAGGAEPSEPPDESAAYAAWLAAEVQEAIDDDGPTMSTEEVMREVRATVFGK
jgi:predicted RNase H-like HicB family nuclease